MRFYLFSRVQKFHKKEKRRKIMAARHWCREQSAHKRVPTRLTQSRIWFSLTVQRSSMHLFKRVDLVGKSILFQDSKGFNGVLVGLKALQAGSLPRQLEVVPRPLPVTRLLSAQTIQLLLDYHLIMKPVERGPVVRLWHWKTAARFLLFHSTRCQRFKRGGVDVLS